MRKEDEFGNTALQTVEMSFLFFAEPGSSVFKCNLDFFFSLECKFGFFKGRRAKSPDYIIGKTKSFPGYTCKIWIEFAVFVGIMEKADRIESGRNTLEYNLHITDLCFAAFTFPPGLHEFLVRIVKTRWQSKGSKAKVGEVELVFEKVPPGTYAISVFHDANENGKLDSNFAGIPKEGFGFSNNAMGMFGPPSFGEAKFAFEGEKKIEITLKYR